VDWIASPEIWASLVTLTALEIVLGIDNIVMIAVIANALPPEQRDRARLIGISLALITRLLLISPSAGSPAWSSRCSMSGASLSRAAT
jgi:predicted tellurium resistance membrane protein TerC